MPDPGTTNTDVQSASFIDWAKSLGSLPGDMIKSAVSLATMNINMSIFNNKIATMMARTTGIGEAIKTFVGGMAARSAAVGGTGATISKNLIAMVGNATASAFSGIAQTA